MKIAVTYDDGNVMQHFGRTEEFLFCDVENGEIKNSRVVSTNGKGHGELPAFLRANGAELVICGGLGAPMKDAVKANGMELVCGVSGNAEEAVLAYLARTIESNPGAVHSGCSHH